MDYEYDLDFIMEAHYETADDIAYDLDDDYERDTYDVQELAYRHYAWYNSHIHTHNAHHMAHVMSVANKRHVQVTLDMYVYEDLELPSSCEEWAKLLGLEGDEQLHSNINDYSRIEY